MNKLTILQLYPRDMNIYGDYGNVLALKKRAEWRGVGVEVTDYNVGDDFSAAAAKADIIVGGGGQDSGQLKIQQDLLEIGDDIKRLATADVPMLVICGLYQLFGRLFVTQDGQEIQGIGLFDAETRAGEARLIGNVVIESDEFGEIIGYENHSGQTTLGIGTKPLGKVIRGAGNDEKSGLEGARYKNVIGSYLHGSLLPKNPKIADFLLEKALLKNGVVIELKPLGIDEIIQKARAVAKGRSR